MRVKDSYPIPRIDDSLEQLAGAQWFSCLDLNAGYWQVEVDEADREKTAFTSRRGLFEFKTMPLDSVMRRQHLKGLWRPCWQA